jgi:hypothetical protein
MRRAIAESLIASPLSLDTPWNSPVTSNRSELILRLVRHDSAGAQNHDLG